MSNTERGFAIVTHGGAGEPLEYSDGCARAAQRGYEIIIDTGDALEAAIAAVMVFEEDERFNAGTGAVLCLDGATIEMDASIMDTRGRLGAIAGVRDVRNPILLARAVADTPHVLLAGEGADRLARALGMEPAKPISAAQREKHEKLLKQLAGSVPVMPGIDNRLFERFWNYKTPLQLPPSAAHDTVGAVVRGPDGHFAVAGSTGGSAPSLLGRVGDTAIMGCGFYAGPLGAIAATGVGEHIVRHMLARTVYGYVEQGMPLQQALRRGIDLIDRDVDTGLIAVTRTEAASCSNTHMPTGLIEK
ncbi:MULTISPECIES: isoaspartyl peptidase/L-asparaginase [unclassified Massilia]|uniref:isoaspartyl peptidase/L-asparaginase n=1 Tax=unclassified Massilia TaxID=2609279 RepID=UPI00177B67C9|nr:isoaspartyl peptidase/L-asparaginase [Massilia sp. CFBP 13647]MBD8675266.1 isoaspartyl peptidase/L-asparaginase [Massilia sp. CFBP 13721]